VKLVTVGYLAQAVNRTTWSIRHWQAIGLMPPPPFHTNHPNPLYRRGVYPQSFVDAVAEIVKRNEIGPRLERRFWSAFRNEVDIAYEETVESLLTGEDGGGSVSSQPTSNRHIEPAKRL
jgi:hypothetical protein